MATQAFLMQPSGKPVKARPRDPYSAEDFEEFIELYQASNKGRSPSGPEMMAYYEQHQDQYKDRFNEGWAEVEKRKRKYGGVAK